MTERRVNGIRAPIQLPAEWKSSKTGSAEALFCRDICSRGIGILTNKSDTFKNHKRDLDGTVLIKLPNGDQLQIQTEFVWKGDRILDTPHQFSGGYPAGLRVIDVRINGNGEKPDLMELLTRAGVISPVSSPSPADKVRWRFPGSKFIYKKNILLKHTNVEGNVYYDNYISWQGEAREALLLNHPDVASFMQSADPIKMITHSLQHHYFKDTFFGDEITIEVTSTKIRSCSFVLIFRYFSRRAQNALVGEGWQRICFSNFKSGKICPTPQLILDLIEPIEEKNPGSRQEPNAW